MKKTVLVVGLLLLAFTAGSQEPVFSVPDWQTWKKGPAWLEDAVIYQIYPSSFKDSDADGIGDLRGITGKLDYLEYLGVDAIWLNPVFESSWLDGGYDITDFYKVDARFGSNDDLVNLIEKAHEKNIKVLLDLVAGHTSWKHPWFLQSSMGTNQRYSDYYIWSDRLPDARAQQDLTQMLSSPEPLKDTKGSWMVSDSPRGKYYNKNFYATQPALNYGYAHPDPDHPWEQGMDAPGPQAVCRELKNIISFWFDKGVDGFRVDMAASLIKDDEDHFPYAKHFWRKMREWMDKEYPDHVLMAEWGGPKDCLEAGFNVDMDLTGRGSKTHAIYQDEHSQTDKNSYFSLPGAPDAEDILHGWADRCSDEFEHIKNMGYFATITGNHDQFRMNTGERNTPEQLKVMMSFILTMPMPIIYYGEEIGMRSETGLPSIEGSNHNGHERSGARTPMQWDGSATAGFSACSPTDLYLPVCTHWTNSSSHGSPTVASQKEDRQSLLEFTRSLIRLRKEHKAFHASSEWTPVYSEGKAYPMVYIRSCENEKWLVALNPTGHSQNTIIPHTASFNGETKEKITAGKASFKARRSGDRISLGPVSLMIVNLSEGNR